MILLNTVCMCLDSLSCPKAKCGTNGREMLTTRDRAVETICVAANTIQQPVCDKYMRDMCTVRGAQHMEIINKDTNEIKINEMFC